jgi:hypothetical protein
MIGSRVFSHEFHRGPVFATLFRMEAQPSQAREFLRQIGMKTRRELAVVVANGGSCSPAPAV